MNGGEFRFLKWDSVQNRRAFGRTDCCLEQGFAKVGTRISVDPRMKK